MIANFLSAVSALAEVEGRIARVFGDQKFNEAGIYKFQERVDGIIQEILIDDFFQSISTISPFSANRIRTNFGF